MEIICSCTKMDSQSGHTLFSLERQKQGLSASRSNSRARIPGPELGLPRARPLSGEKFLWKTCSEETWEHHARLPSPPSCPRPSGRAESEGSLPQSPGSRRSRPEGRDGLARKGTGSSGAPAFPRPARALPLPPGYSPPSAAAPSRRGRAAAGTASAAGPAHPRRAARAARARPPAARRARGPRSPPPPPSWPPQEGRGGGQRAAGSAGRERRRTPRTTTPSVHRGGE